MYAQKMKKGEDRDRQTECKDLNIEEPFYDLLHTIGRRTSVLAGA